MAKRQQRVSFQQHLQAVPERCPPLRKAYKDGVLRLTVEACYGGLLGHLQGIFQITREKPYDLDGLALEVYESIDGKRTLENLIDLFATRHHVTFLEARALLSQFLQMLEKRDLIEITLPESG